MVDITRKGPVRGLTREQRRKQYRSPKVKSMGTGPTGNIGEIHKPIYSKTVRDNYRKNLSPSDRKKFDQLTTEKQDAEIAGDSEGRYPFLSPIIPYSPKVSPDFKGSRHDKVAAKGGYIKKYAKGGGVRKARY